MEERFTLRTLRSGRLYQDLTNPPLTSEEKIYFLETIWFPHQQLKEIPDSKLLERYNLAPSTVQRWVDTYRSTGTIRDRSGRPSKIDQQGKEDTDSTLKEREEAKKPLSMEETDDLLIEAMKATAKRRNEVLLSDPCAKTLKKYKQANKIHDVKPQLQSMARFKACSDPRMSYAMRIMLKSCTLTLPPNLIWNWDATQFICRKSGSGKMVCVIENRDRSQPVTTIGDDPLDIAIKWMHMGSANGQAVPLVLLVAVPDMKDEEFHCFAVPGLTYGVDIDAIGYLTFCKTRVGNSSFFRWFASIIAFPAVVASRNRHESKDMDGQPCQGFISCDGEAIVIDVLMNNELNEQMKDSLVSLGKVSASCSSIHQASDVSPLFRAAKKRLETITKKSISTANEVVEKHIRNLLNGCDISAIKNLSSEARNKIVFGCLSIRYTLQDVIKPRLIEEGFVASGQYPLSFETIMSQCYKKATKEELDTMKSTTDDDVAYFLSHGQLTEEQLDKNQIPVAEDEGGIPRNERPIQNQRAVLLSHPSSLQRYAAYMNRGLQLGDTVLNTTSGSERKELTAAIKLVANEEKKRQTQEKRKEESARKAKLTKEEKAAEKAEKTAKSAAKITQKAKQVKEARELLNVTGKLQH